MHHIELYLIKIYINMPSINGIPYEKTINLALQGGGAHGAFTWGVLDRILEDARLFISAISGTSAGAMNAVVMADGFAKTNTKDGAREALRNYWYKISQVGQFSPIQRSLFDRFFGNWSLDNSPSYLFSQILTRVASPYNLNPSNINLLRDLVEELIDFEAVRNCKNLLVYVSATNVNTGRVKVFGLENMDADRVLASACLPTLYQAIEIDGVPYWDGGYGGNPVLFPFYKESPSNDILIVQINPLYREGTPKTASEISNRLNEITFNSSLLLELRGVEFVRRLLDSGKLDEKLYRKVNIHMLGGLHELYNLDASSKLNTEWAFFQHLFEIGRKSASTWLDENYEHIGVDSSINLWELVQGDVRYTFER